MNAWQELVKMALLGTEKMPLQTAVLPQNIQNILEKADKMDKEAHFFKAAALTLTYWKAGQIRDNTPLPEIVVAPEETQDFAPPQYIAVLKRLLNEGVNKSTDLYVLLFEKIKQHNFVIPHESLFSVLSLLEIPVFKTKKTLINDIVGVRGQWLQQFNAKWQVAKTQDDDTIWAEGTSAERRLMLSELRYNDPNQAFLLIKNAWETENARERKEYIKILSHNPQADEWTFVQTIYNDLVASKTASKAINQEILEIVAKLLLQNADSDLHKSVVERLKKYVSTKSKFLGLQSKTVLELPTEEDDFLNKEVMKTEFVLTSTPSTNELLTEYWFCYFLQNLHPTAWENMLNTNDWHLIFNILEEADKHFTSGRKKQLRNTFLQNLAIAFSETQYKKGVLVYLEKHTINSTNENLLNTLTHEELEKYCIQNMLMGEYNNSGRNKLLRDNWRWSNDLSLHILRGLIKNPQEIYYNSQFAINAAIHLDDAVLPELYELSKQEAPEWQQQQIRNALAVPLIQFLELRKEIENL
jgi:Family of unknown function (DUF5691)